MTQVINEKLGAWLLEEGHNQERLASELGITRPTLRNRLNGNTKWTSDEVIAVSRITNCTLNDLAGIGKPI